MTFLVFLGWISNSVEFDELSVLENGEYGLFGNIN